MQRVIRSDEARLEAEIARLGEMIEGENGTHSQTSKWARSYLRQLLNDRERQLSLLRYRNQEVDEAQTAAR